MNDNPEPEKTTALWIPGWFELDQAIRAGDYDRFWFYRDVPFEILGRSEVQAYFNDRQNPVEFVFFNALPDAGDHELRYARVERIEHVLLGEIREIRTDGLDYLVVPSDGQPMRVDAEEHPGKTAEGEPEIDDWTMRVTLTDLSAPLTE